MAVAGAGVETNPLEWHMPIPYLTAIQTLFAPSVRYSAHFFVRGQCRSCLHSHTMYKPGGVGLDCRRLHQSAAYYIQSREMQHTIDDCLYHL